MTTSTSVSDDLGLAPLFPLAGFEGSLGDYVDDLYRQYHDVVYDAGIQLWGMPLVARGKKAADGRDLLFWHLITSSTTEKTEETRRLAPKRCAYLPRVWDVLERLARDDIRVCWWREPRAHICVAPVDFSLIVELRRVRGTYEVWTAFPTDKPRKRRRTFERAASRWAVSRCFHPPGGADLTR